MAAAAAAAVEKAAAADRAEAARSQAELGSQEGLVSQSSAGDGMPDGSGGVEQQRGGLDTASDGAVPAANEHAHLQLPGSELPEKAHAGPGLGALAESSVTEPPQAPLSAAAVSSQQTQQVPVQEGGSLHAQGAQPQQQPAAAAAAKPVLGQQRSGNPFADPLPAAALEARPSGNPFAGGSALDSPAAPSESSRAAWLANLADLAEVTRAVETQHPQQAHTLPGSGLAQPQTDDLLGSQGGLPLAAATAGPQTTVPPAAGLSRAKGDGQQSQGAPAGRATLQTSEGTGPVPDPAATAVVQGTGEGRPRREQAAFPKPPVWADTAPAAAQSRAGGPAPEGPAAAMLQVAAVPHVAQMSAAAGASRAASPALESRSEQPGALHAPLHQEHRAAGTQHARAVGDHTQAARQQAAQQQAPPPGAVDDPMQALLEERLQRRAGTQAQSGQRPPPPDPMQALLEERQQQQQLQRQPGAANSLAAAGAAPDEVPAAELQAWVAAERRQREAEGLQAADEDMSEAEHVAVSRSADLGAVTGLHRELGPRVFML